MTKEQLIKEFREKFVVEADDVFIVVANEDELKELEAFLLSAFDAGEKNGIAIGRASGIEEVKELRRLHANCGWGFTANEYNEKIDEAIKSLTPSSSKDN